MSGAFSTQSLLFVCQLQAHTVQKREVQQEVKMQITGVHKQSTANRKLFKKKCTFHHKKHFFLLLLLKQSYFIYTIYCHWLILKLIAH